ncbi:hypothetical protein QO005_004238 [Rhizobium paknamense]|uniref:Propionyl-coenzyme A carboxylase alpha polypeptide n=1 Tax=Rhizobium paknamense TaxID=1206817 RepID=A0ABU0IKC3_9HYPH|nr:hypothetical protein [Rhizobium paknamense]
MTEAKGSFPGKTGGKGKLLKRTGKLHASSRIEGRCLPVYNLPLPRKQASNGDDFL